MTIKITTLILSTLLLKIISGCGTSLYSPITNKNSSTALREKTILLLNNGQYEEAEASAEQLWTLYKSNANASLYSIAIASAAGAGLFDLTIKSINSATSANNSKTSSTTTGNNVFNTLSSVLPSFTESQMAKLKRSIEILDSAPEKSTTDLKFQRCLTAGIYTVPTITQLQQSITEVQTSLTSLPEKLATGSGSTCNAPATAINSAASEISSSISNLATIATNFAGAMAIVGECFPSSSGQNSVNSISQQVSMLKENADKGCVIPATQKIGTYTLPSCLNETVNSTGGSTAIANDGIIAGCELFINCSSGSCL